MTFFLIFALNSLYILASFNFQFITCGLICLLAMRILGITNVGDVPGDSPYDSSDDDKQEYLNRLVHAILQETVPSLPTAIITTVITFIEIR